MRGQVLLGCLLISVIVVVVCVCDVASADSSSWSKVVEFSGSGTEGYFTDDFTCDHAEWRIVWNYSTFPENADSAVFSFIVYPGKGGASISSIDEFGASNTSGIVYVHNQSGAFYGAVDAENTASYDIIVEQDLNSIPELSAPMVLSFVAALTLLTVSFHRRAEQKRKRNNAVRLTMSYIGKT